MSSVARVYLNDVEVGSLPATDYRSIVANTKKDWKLYFLQVLILMKAVLNIIAFGFRAIPAFLLLAIVLGVVFFPEQVTENLEALSKFTIGEIVEGAQNLFVSIWIITSILTPAFLMTWRPNSFGFYDVFDDKVNQEIRKILEVPTTGNLTVVCYELINEQQ